MRRRALKLGVPAALAAAAVGAGVWAMTATGDDEPGDGTANAAAATATVERRDLVDRETFSGTLSYADSRALTGTLSGTITSTAAEGSVRRRGESLYRVDEQPVVLMYGDIPVYRALGASSENGTDILQLERNLRALGYDPDGDMTVDRDWDWATTNAVERWQEDMGLEEDGAVELGRVVFLPGPRRIGAIKAAIGARAGGVVMTTTSTARTVSVDLDARRQDLVRVGASQRVELPDGRTVPARISAVGSVATAAAEGVDPTIEVTLTLNSTRGATLLDAAPVRVELTREVRRGALTVPVSALLALAGGGFGLERVNGDGSHTIVAVDAGLQADGQVEVTGPGIVEGATVVTAP